MHPWTEDMPTPVWYVPTEHAKHAEGMLLPVPVMYVPGGQGAHCPVLPDPVWYVPLAQARH